MSLGIVGVRSGMPFSLENPPWQGFDYSFDLVKKTFSSVEQVSADEVAKAGKDDEKRKKHEAALSLVRQWSATVDSYRTQRYRELHTIGCFALAILLSGLAAYVSAGFSRKLLRDLSIVTTMTNALAIIFAEVLLYFLIYVAVTTLLTIAAIPITSVGFGAILGVGVYFSKFVGFVLAVISMWILSFITPLWVKVAGDVGALPISVVLLCAIAAFILCPFRNIVRRTMLFCLNRALRSKKGPIAFFTSAAVCIAGIIALWVSR
jgi:hypothetical protein